jgi:hypothetical protein
MAEDFPSYLPVPGKRIRFTVVPKAPFEECGMVAEVLEAVVLSRRMEVKNNARVAVTTSDPDYRVLVSTREGNWSCHPEGAQTIQEGVEIRGIHVVDE